MLRGDLSRRASLTAIASLLDYGARLLVQFVVNPLLVTALGTYLFGAWRVLWQLSGYLWATSGRSAQALQWVITRGQASEDVEEKRSYVASSVTVWVIFAPILAGIGGLGAWLAPTYLEAPPQYVWVVRTAAALLVIDALALTLLSISRAVLQGENLGYKRMGLSALLVLLGGALMVLAVYLDTGIVGVAAANLFTTVLTGVLFWRITRRYVPWFGLSRPSRATVRWFLGLSGWFTLWKFVYEFSVAADVVVLGLFASVELVTPYTLTKMIPEALIVFLTANLLQGTGPGLGGIIAEGDLARAIRVRNEIMVLSWTIVTVVGATVLLWNRSFVALWVGSGRYAGAVPTLLIVVNAMQFVFVSNDARVIDMTLRVRTKVLTGVASAILGFTLAAIFAKTFDDQIVGVCVGILAGRAILTFVYPALVGRYLGHPLIAQLRGALRPLLTTACLFGIALTIGRHMSAPSWPSLIGGSGVTAIGLAAIAVLLGLTSAQRATLIKRVRRIL